jgi:hypothetical protein
VELPGDLVVLLSWWPFCLSLLSAGITGMSCYAWNAIFNILRKYYTVFHPDHTTTHSYQQWKRDLLSPHPCQHLLFSVFFF